MSWNTALQDSQRFLYLYGTTPPRADASEERIQRAAERLVERISPIGMDGLIVYDVQDESDRTNEPRPFPFLPTLDSRYYARLLAQKSNRPVIAYKCIAGMSVQDWDRWLEDAANEYGIHSLSLVGRASSRMATGGISLLEATEAAVRSPHPFVLGGVTIPERHRPGRSESQRLLQKTSVGCSFFVSQAVYDSAATIRLCRDYQRECLESGEEPKRIILTFTPCGRSETLEFMRWLGIAIPDAAANAMLLADSPLAESLRLCAQNLREILEATAELGIPLGVNVESVSIRKEEIAATVDLVHGLREVARDYFS